MWVDWGCWYCPLWPDQTCAALQIAKYAKGIGPWKSSYVVVNASNYIESIDSAFVENAHAAGLQLHPYTFRNEER